MKTPDRIKDAVRTCILGQFPAARQKAIRDDDPLLELGIVDSLGVLDVIADLESEFDIRIADDEVEVDDFESIEALADFIRRKIGCTTSN